MCWLSVLEIRVHVLMFVFDFVEGSLEGSVSGIVRHGQQMIQGFFIFGGLPVRGENVGVIVRVGVSVSVVFHCCCSRL